MEEDAEKINNESIKVEEDGFCASIEVSFIILLSQYITIKKECAGTYARDSSCLSNQVKGWGEEKGWLNILDQEDLLLLLKKPTPFAGQLIVSNKD